MKWTVIVASLVLATASVADKLVDADGDGMPDAWEKQYGLNPSNATDAATDADQDGFTNLEEFKGGTAPVGRSVHSALYVHRVVARGTNRWIHFLQLAGKPVWVREGKPDGPVGSVPDWKNRRLWNRISHVAVNDSVATNIQVVITFQPEDGKTNTWSVPFVADCPRMVLKEQDKKQANKPNGE